MPVIDDLVAAVTGRADRPALGEDVPVRDVAVRVLAAPPGDDVGRSAMRMPRMDDSPAASIAFRLASDYCNGQGL
jgi:hypothetical protein